MTGDHPNAKPDHKADTSGNGPDASDFLVTTGIILMAVAIGGLASPLWAIAWVGLAMMALGIIKGRA